MAGRRIAASCAEALWLRHPPPRKAAARQAIAVDFIFGSGNGKTDSGNRRRRARSKQVGVAADSFSSR